MQFYVCYVHTPSTMTPQMRVVMADGKEGLLDAMNELMGEWPRFDLLDVYDANDLLVMRLGQWGGTGIC